MHVVTKIGGNGSDVNSESMPFPDTDMHGQLKNTLDLESSCESSISNANKTSVGSVSFEMCAEPNDNGSDTISETETLFNESTQPRISKKNIFNSGKYTTSETLSESHNRKKGSCVTNAICIDDDILPDDAGIVNQFGAAMAQGLQRPEHVFVNNHLSDSNMHDLNKPRSFNSAFAKGMDVKLAGQPSNRFENWDSAEYDSSGSSCHKKRCRPKSQKSKTPSNKKTSKSPITKGKMTKFKRLQTLFTELVDPDADAACIKFEFSEAGYVTVVPINDGLDGRGSFLDELEQDSSCNQTENSSGSPGEPSDISIHIEEDSAAPFLTPIKLMGSSVLHDQAFFDKRFSTMTIDEIADDQAFVPKVEYESQAIASLWRFDKDVPDSLLGAQAMLLIHRNPDTQIYQVPYLSK